MKRREGERVKKRRRGEERRGGGEVRETEERCPLITVSQSDRHCIRISNAHLRSDKSRLQNIV